jgi:aryl-alcohol dehydrogenase-like predicted oxidoreductase
MREKPNGSDLSRKAIMSEINHSLKRLGTDYVDLYIIHRWDYHTPIEETLSALHDIVKAGKARYIGASAMYAWQFQKALYTAEKNEPRTWKNPIYRIELPVLPERRQSLSRIFSNKVDPKLQFWINLQRS